MFFEVIVCPFTLFKAPTEIEDYESLHFSACRFNIASYQLLSLPSHSQLDDGSCDQNSKVISSANGYDFSRWRNNAVYHCSTVSNKLKEMQLPDRTHKVIQAVWLSVPSHGRQRKEHSQGDELLV